MSAFPLSDALFADGGRSAQQSAAWGGGELPISRRDIEEHCGRFHL